MNRVQIKDLSFLPRKRSTAYGGSQHSVISEQERIVGGEGREGGECLGLVKKKKKSYKKP